MLSHRQNTITNQRRNYFSYFLLGQLTVVAGIARQSDYFVTKQLTHMNLLQLMEECSTNDATYNFLKQRHILRSVPPICPNCARDMTVVKDASRVNGKMTWRCPSHKGRKVSIRDGSWLQDSRLSSRHFVLIAYMWSIDSTNAHVVDMLDVDMETVVQYFRYFRDVCSR